VQEEYEVTILEQLPAVDTFESDCTNLREVRASSILNKSGITDYCVNAYSGCAFACKYCYAQLLMKRFRPRDEAWGEYVDAKTNAPEVLRKQLHKAEKGRVMLSSVTDAYQPLEAKYELTRKCLQALLERQFPVCIQTKSTLVLRDAALISEFKDAEVGLTITTNNEDVRRLFEPNSPSSSERIRALRELHGRGIRTYAFIGPMLPMDEEKLASDLSNAVDFVFLDKMNYSFLAKKTYGENNIQYAMGDLFFNDKKEKLSKLFNEAGVECRVLF
jgi:DNA repair photolyase